MKTMVNHFKNIFGEESECMPKEIKHTHLNYLKVKIIFKHQQSNNMINAWNI